MAYRHELIDLDGGRGRVDLVSFEDRGLIDLEAALAGATPATSVYCCGPEPLLAAAEYECGRLDLKLRTERFAPRSESKSPSTAFTVRIASTGQEFLVPADKPVSEVLVDAGLDVLTSCEEGTCGTCETQVLSGVPEHRDVVLTADERAAGQSMMLCVSRARSPVLVLDL